MKKKKINFKKYADMHEETELTGKDGTTITVRNHTPYEEKVQMATRLVENYVMIHDDSVSYESHKTPAALLYEIVNCYTNVNTEDATPEEVADFVINNELIGKIREVVRDDHFEFQDIYVTLLRSVMDNYDDDQSLKKAIKTSFGFLFNGEDITESMAKAEMTRDTMFRALDALNQKEKEESEKMNNGKLNVGGNIISFAKRE